MHIMYISLWKYILIHNQLKVALCSWRVHKGAPQSPSSSKNKFLKWDILIIQNVLNPTKKEKGKRKKKKEKRKKSWVTWNAKILKLTEWSPTWTRPKASYLLPSFSLFSLLRNCAAREERTKSDYLPGWQAHKYNGMWNLFM